MCELPAFMNTEHPKARKEHKCFECGGVIQKGEKYEKIEGVWDGNFYRFKTCNDCAELRNEFMKDDKKSDPYMHSEIVFGNLFEECDYRDQIPRIIQIKRKRGAKIPDRYKD